MLRTNFSWFRMSYVIVHISVHYHSTKVSVSYVRIEKDMAVDFF